MKPDENGFYRDLMGKTWRVHEDGKCRGEVCPFHNPTEHEYRDLPWMFVGGSVVRVFPDNRKVIDPDDYRLNTHDAVILINRARCVKCNQVVESETRHHFASCRCGQMFVDGGTDYLRRGGKFIEESWVESKESG